MIAVKGTKTQTPQTDPADRYVLKIEPKNSRTPYVIGALLSAIALYLRSAVASVAGQDHGKAAPAQEPDGARGAADTDNMPPPPQETSVDKWPEPDNATRESFVFSYRGAEPSSLGAFGDDDNVAVSRPVRRLNAANSDGPPVIAPSDLDYMALFGGHEELSDAWLPAAGEAADSDPDNKNRAPRSGRPTYLLDVTSGAAALIALSDLLANMTDPDGDVLAITDASVSSGTLIKVEGGYLYRPGPDALGPVQLSFTVSDGRASVVEVAHFSVMPNPVEGTENGGMISGTRFSDVIRGLGGDDNIDALAGSDIIDGGAGDDNISGGAGDDVIFGGAGNDNILGGAGNDRISGGDGDDTIFGDEGNDVLHGDAGDDMLSDGTGADAVFGGDGDDLVVASPDASDDVYDGGDGHDTLDYSAAAADLRVDLVSNVAAGDDIGSDTISDFETIMLGRGDDHVVIGGNEVTLFGGGGANTFEFVDILKANAPAVTAHQIIDFSTGDRIKTNKHLIFDKPDDDDDLFDAMTGGSSGSDDICRIRYRHETYEDREETIVEWDNDDFTQLTVVTLNGHHILVWSETA
jgi:hypothetical protein